MLLKITCKEDFSTLWDFSCIPDGGLEWIDLLYFVAASRDSNGDQVLGPRVSII